MAIERKEDQKPDKRRNRHGSSEELFGMDVGSMSPTAQVATGAIALGGVVAVYVLALVLAGAWLWWLIFPAMGILFPAFGLFLRGVAGVVDSDREDKPSSSGTTGRERELLEALSRKGEMTPAQAAMETSLTVREADEMMKELASDGHLDVRVHGGGIFYALWDYDRDAASGNDPS